MEACIARGGISHVLSQARASLKNPSRPYTPRTTTRSLFHGDDYRPGSRPSSSYTAAEQQELRQQPSRRTGCSSTLSSPSESMLPPRARSSKTRKSAAAVATRPPSSPEDDDADPLAASTSLLKLVHAPVVHDIAAVTSSQHDNVSDSSDSDDHLEASLELPSPDQLRETYAAAQRALDALAASSSTSANDDDAVATLCDALASFLHVSAFFVSSRVSADAASAGAGATTLRLQLFEAAATVALERSSHSAACVVALAPSLFELCSANGQQQQRHQRHSISGASTNSSSSSVSQRAVALAKHLFMLSKDAVNDRAFCSVAYVEAALRLLAIGSTSRRRISSKPLSEDDVPVTIDSAQLAVPMRMLIYVAGTLKTTSSGDAAMLKLLAAHGAVAVLSATLRWRPAVSTGSSSNGDDLSTAAGAAKDVAQCLVQTTAVLRNLAATRSCHKQFVAARVATRLCALAAPPFAHHVELMGNVARVLSKLTLHEQPRAQLNEHAAQHLRRLLAVVASTLSNEPSKAQDALLLRVFFVLGNLCAGNDRNREVIALECSDGIAVLLHALQVYAKRYAASEASEVGTTDTTRDSDAVAASGSSSTDVLVKLVRVLANVVINADAGARVNRESAALAVLLPTLARAQRDGDEELMLNIVSCVTNLSYYSAAAVVVNGSDCNEAVATTPTFIERYRLEIVALLAPILLDRNDEAVVEAARAFGNLTRFHDVLAAMQQAPQRALECLVVLLDHSNREIVFTVCGVLMNAARDEPTRQQLLHVQLSDSSSSNSISSDVRSLLLGLVECAAIDDVAMACIACKVLYNLLLPPSGTSDTSGSSSSFDVHALRSVVQRLSAAMDAKDARRSTTRPRLSDDTTQVTHDDSDDNGDNDDNDGDNDDSYANDWRELRLVLPQLLRSASAAAR